MKEIITSSQNKHIKHIKALHAKKNRDSLSQYIIEGYKITRRISRKLAVFWEVK